MMKTIVVFLSVLWGMVAYAQPDQPPDTLWTREYGTSSSEIGYAIAITPDDHAVIVGSGSSPNRGDTDFYVVYLNAQGDTVWTRFFGTTAGEVAKAVRRMPDGNFLIVGTNGEEGNIFAVRITDTGTQVWSRTYGSLTAAEDALSVTRMVDGNYAIVGSSSNNGAALDAFALKITENGDSVWMTVFGGAGDQLATSVYAIPDGAMVVGWSGVSPAPLDALVAKLNTNGSVTWLRHYGGAGLDEACGILSTLDNGFMVAGSTSDTRGAGQLDYFLLKLNANGDSVWLHTYGTQAWEQAAQMAPASDGGFVIGGTTQNLQRGDFDFRLIKVNAAGEIRWAKNVGGEENDYCYGMDKSRDGGFVAVGWTNSFGHGGLDAYTVRFSGFSGVGGHVNNETTGLPIPGARVSAVGETAIGVADDSGHYVLVLAPGTYSLIVYGPCVERDTIPNVTVLEDSIITHDILVGQPDADVPQTSVNIVVPHGQPGIGTLLISNHGSGLLDYGLTWVTLDPPSPWLHVEPSSGHLAQDQSVELNVTVTQDTTDSSSFDYFGYLDVHLNSCPDTVIRVVVTAVVVTNDADAVPTLAYTYDLGAYPNPFNPTTSITWSLAQSQEISLTVFDVMGREVQRLAQGQSEAGAHRTVFDARELPSGVYFARLSGQKFQLITKLMVMK